MNSTICIAEDRHSCEPCVRLLIASLNRYAPDMQISLFYPPADHTFHKWLSAFPQVSLHSESLAAGLGWNIKPHAILHLFNAGFDEVIWIDSDILITNDLRAALGRIDYRTVVVTAHTRSPERDDRNGRRAQMWNLPIGRPLDEAISSGLVRVTRAHYDLTEQWRSLLRSEEYAEAQLKPWADRPINMLGDQDVLTALLTSSNFAHVPLLILERGKDIIQFDGVWGYSTFDRLRGLFAGQPCLIHSGAGKPWAEAWTDNSPQTFVDYLKQVYLDVSPYTLFARRFRSELGSHSEWMDSHFTLSSCLRLLGFGIPQLIGLPLALLADIVRTISWLRGQISSLTQTTMDMPH